MTTRPHARTDRPTKIVVFPGDAPWTGVAYTTRGSSRRVYGDPVELLRTIAELTGWPAAETVRPAPGDHE